ncbi:NfeD family protein [Actinomyces sp. S4-C9]|uniref:NfeD family protein n=1 Tax=Actinomyces sp. S4-C9 TaxID=1219581 RepID=UPI00050FC194|nr:NfeD family protein [Actinomyces sp. S4-C9]KGF01872.1 hypothetical protein HMPREF1628_03580 [Actinomyces sp. S4-C9]
MTLAWWLVIALGLGVVEVLTVDFIFINLAFAAVAAGLISYAGFDLVVQLVAFSVVAVLLLLLVRPWAKSFMERHTPNIQTNVRALVGQTATVLEPVDQHDGRIRLDGEIWSARTNVGEIPVGTSVIVTEIDGATAVVDLKS